MLTLQWVAAASTCSKVSCNRNGFEIIQTWVQIPASTFKAMVWESFFALLICGPPFFFPLSYKTQRKTSRHAYFVYVWVNLCVWVPEANLGVSVFRSHSSCYLFIQCVRVFCLDHVCACSLGARRGYQMPWNLGCGCWELNSSPLERWLSN